MRAPERRWQPVQWTADHLVDLVFAALAIGWLAYSLRLMSDFYFWSDDLRVIEQAGTFGGLFRPYNQNMSLVPLLSDRVLAELSGFSYTPFIVFGALSFLAVPVTYYVTTRGRFGPPLAAVLATFLLWPEGLNSRPATASHYLVVVGAIVCAAALNRGPRADWILAAGLAFALASAGGGLVVAGACLVHSLLTRPPLRRWLAIAVPLALWIGWWLLAASAAGPTSATSLTAGETLEVVRDLVLQPFYLASLGNRFVAYLLMAAFLVHGCNQLRHGLRAGANFVAWTAAMVAWPLALVQSRGTLADALTFRYAYVSLAFALLAVVPREPIRWPAAVAADNRRWVAAAAVAVLALGAASAITAREGMQVYARQNAERGREAEGTMLLLGAGVLPDPTRIVFFGFDNPHGTAGRLRSLVERYGSLPEARVETLDQELVDRGVARSRRVGRQSHPGCEPLTEPLLQPGIHSPGLGAPPANAVVPDPPPVPVQLWSDAPYTVDIRRFGETWVRLDDVPAGRSVVLTLPALSTEQPWEVRSDGACDVRP